MGAMGGLLGVAGGAGGTGFAGPSGANLIQPVTSDQLKTSYGSNQDALKQQQSLLTALQGQNGIANQSQTYGQLQGIVNGTGPNPAQAMLNNQTGQNVANQAALMAGQRGAGANVGLMARQAGQQGAGIQQQAVGQGAAMQAQQALNALNQASGVAGQQVQNQMGATGANTQAQQGEQGQLLGAAGNYNATQAGMQANINSTNAGLAGQMMTGQQGLLGGAMNGLGGAAGMMGGGGGGGMGAMPKLMPPAGSMLMQAQGGMIPQSGFNKFMSSRFAHGGSVPALVSPGEKYLSPSDVERVKSGANPMKVGETIGGKPKVGGAKNSYANDTVKKTLQSGGIVVPRSETKSKNPERKSAEFVAKVLAKRRK